jgi:leader peptidase (prepilin peptidase)/N-methyltransferase
MWPAHEAAWLGAATVLVGWLLGSFLNQLIDRTPRRGGGAAGPAAGVETPTLLRPVRSFCFHCGTAIPWYDNLPLLSFVWLRGACRACGARIGLRTLAVEAATPAAFAGLYLLHAARGAAAHQAVWDYLLLSWALPALVMLAERRRIGWGMAALGAGLAPAWLFLSGHM